VQLPVTLTMSRRLALLRLAAQKHFAIIEDDYDHEFHYGAHPVLPMASIDTTRIVVYIGSLSKVLAPGIRLGFVVAPNDLFVDAEHLSLSHEAAGNRITIATAKLPRVPGTGWRNSHLGANARCEYHDWVGKGGEKSWRGFRCRNSLHT
jgi:hypothetical protein